VFWLSFRGDGEAVTATVSIETPSGEPIEKWTDIASDGITGLAVAGARLGTSAVVLRVDADRPVPGDVVIGTQRGRDAMKFPLGRDRLPDTRYWFRPPFAPAGIRDSHAAVLGGKGGTLRVPVPLGEGFQELEVMLTLDTVGTGTDTMRVTYLHDGDPLAVFEVAPSVPTVYQAVRIPRPGTDRHVDIDIRVDDPSRGRYALRLRELSLWTRAWVE
jgi:hypothetical protein